MIAISVAESPPVEWGGGGGGVSAILHEGNMGTEACFCLNSF